MSDSLSVGEFDAKWSALRAVFIVRLPARIAEAERLCVACADAAEDDAADKLFHLAHSLAGTGATFGFTELAAAARLVETTIEALIGSAPERSPASTNALHAKLASASTRLAEVAAGLGTSHAPKAAT